MPTILFFRWQLDQSVLVGQLRQIFGVDLVFVAIEIFLPETEELDIALRHRLTCDSIGDVVQRFFVERFFDDRRVVEPNDDACRVAVGHF